MAEEQASEDLPTDVDFEADQQVDSTAAEAASPVEPEAEDDALIEAPIEELAVDDADLSSQLDEATLEAIAEEPVDEELVEPDDFEQAIAALAEEDQEGMADLASEPDMLDLETTAEEDQQAESSMSEMADLVDDFAFKPLKAGETRDGIIVSVTPNEILVDVGAKSEGFVLQREMERHGREYAETYSVGDSVVVYVIRPEDRDGNVVLSLARAQQERDWREAERLQETAESFESLVIGHNRGGVICRVGKVRGFVPASQLVSKPEIKPDTDEENRWAGLVGETLWLKVVEMDRKRNRLILSERLAMRDRRRGRKDELLGELKKGDVRTGRVSSLAKFGAFVDLGGADGLIHLSELSWSRVNHPSEVVSVGQNVEVYVLTVDRDRKRIGLSLRRLKPEPWSVVHEKYAVGQIVQGVITKLANFGAFARVDGTLEGLIHISELANHRVTHPKEVVKEGEEHRLRIVRIDPARKRMGLSLKRVEDEAYAELDWRTDEIEDEIDEQWDDLEQFEE
jgi:small subunit ribosomal protein S1